MSKGNSKFRVIVPEFSVELDAHALGGFLESLPTSVLPNIQRMVDAHDRPRVTTKKMPRLKQHAFVDLISAPERLNKPKRKGRYGINHDGPSYRSQVADFIKTRGGAPFNKNEIKKALPHLERRVIDGAVFYMFHQKELKRVGVATYQSTGKQA